MIKIKEISNWIYTTQSINCHNILYIRINNSFIILHHTFIAFAYSLQLGTFHKKSSRTINAFSYNCAKNSSNKREILNQYLEKCTHEILTFATIPTICVAALTSLEQENSWPYSFITHAVLKNNVRDYIQKSWTWMCTASLSLKLDL